VSKDNIIKLIHPGNVEDQLTEILRHGARSLLAQAVEAEVLDFLGKQCRFEDRGRPPARRPPRSPAGARGDDRHRPGRGPPTAYAQSRGGSRRSRPHPVLSVDPAALHAPVKVDRDAAADPLPEGDIDRRLLRGAYGAAWQGCCRVVGMGRLKDGWLDEHTAWQKRDLSAKRWCARVLEGGRRGLAENARAALLGAAIHISCNARLALGCWLFGNLASTFAVLSPPHDPIEGLPVQQDPARNGVQIARGRPEKLATARRTQPVAKTRSRCDIQRRDRGHRQADRPSVRNRRRLTSPAVTKNWR
jgi:hypothetical protein